MFNKDVIGRARAGSATNVIGGLKHDGDSVDHKDGDSVDHKDGDSVDVRWHPRNAAGADAHWKYNSALNCHF